jgi:thiaminase/transcriptional activator TenA
MWDNAQRQIDASEKHSFLTAMVDGDLPVEQFRHYVQQDALYLVDFADCLVRLAAHNGVDRRDAAWLKGEAEQCIKAERDLHRTHFAKWGVQEGSIVASPTTLLYCSWMLRIVCTRPYAEGLAAMLPCFWVYLHVGEVMLERRKALGGSVTRPDEFDKWIDMYSGDGYVKTVTKFQQLVEDAARAADGATRAAMTAHFKRGCELEWMFWSAAEKLEGWPPELFPVAVPERRKQVKSSPGGSKSRGHVNNVRLS